MNETPLSLCNASAETLAREVAKLLLARKALDVRLYSVAEHTSVTEFYLNCTGRSSTQVASLADEIAERCKERGREPLRVEGRQGRSWLLVDFGDLIVNVFDRESRDFYHLDRLMPDGSAVDLKNEIEAVDLAYKVIQIKEEEV